MVIYNGKFIDIPQCIIIIIIIIKRETESLLMAA